MTNEEKAARLEEIAQYYLRIADLEAERDAARAGEARAVEALERIRQELETIADGKEGEVRNDFSSGLSRGNRGGVALLGRAAVDRLSRR